MTKIFIDTNIFLDMYRANLPSDISTLLGFIFKNKKHFITTEQSINEFTRNRLSILEEALETFKKNSNVDKSSSSFLRSLSNFKKYDDALSKYRTQRQTIVLPINLCCEIYSTPKWLRRLKLIQALKPYLEF